MFLLCDKFELVSIEKRLNSFNVLEFHDFSFIEFAIKTYTQHYLIARALDTFSVPFLKRIFRWKKERDRKSSGNKIYSVNCPTHHTELPIWIHLALIESFALSLVLCAAVDAVLNKANEKKQKKRENGNFHSLASPVTEKRFEKC